MVGMCKVMALCQPTLQNAEGQLSHESPGMFSRAKKAINEKHIDNNNNFDNSTCIVFHTTMIDTSKALNHGS
jgi:hypothetical protein